MSRPPARCTAPFSSLTASTRAPASAYIVAAGPPTLPKPWTATRTSCSSRPGLVQGGAGRVHDAAGRGRRAAERAADLQGLAGDHRRDRVAAVDRVGVHHPGHRALVGADVRRHDVVLRADHRHDLAGVAPGDALELGRGVAARVDRDAALRPAVGQLDHGALPGHPHRQGADLVDVDRRVVPQAALAGSARDVVLHAVPVEQLGGAVVAPQRDRDVDLAARCGQHRVHPGVVAEPADRAVELAERGAQRAVGRRVVSAGTGGIVVAGSVTVGSDIVLPGFGRRRPEVVVPRSSAEPTVAPRRASCASGAPRVARSARALGRRCSRVGAAA